jgi:DNA-binding response OmpR family regulator
MYKILIIDDSTELRHLMSRMLSKLGHLPREAENGFEGEKLALTWRPDVILLDIAMARQNGYQTCRNLRKQGFTGQIALISALGNAIESHEASTCGANAVLHKPISKDELQAYLRTQPVTA